ncbi:patatin-like phospholipase family protein [Ramlibacter sp. USB13]|uniref:Patatin-like phospholipase family protein n=1 Tax=Ramlibacter cellulosilyticus TaxID=2764187 RepID=A0A923MVR9_9BURK|nr:patatin-like phospholipase family protein [Ramlibacter cellulosilyticus]
MRRRAEAARPPRIGLALAGGGPLGAIYEIGALCALEDCLEGVDFTGLQHYVGVSAGGFIAAGLANGIRPREMCAGFIENNDRAAEVFDPAWLSVPAWSEYGRRLRRLPALAAAAGWQATWGGKAWLQALEGMAPLLPTGLFSNEEIHRRLAALFSVPGRSNDFRALHGRLTLLATELDTGRAVAFGSPGWDHVPVSRAVQATCALPGLFPPVTIEGRAYVDGALTKTMHASAALADGADLVLCVNPLVPFDVPDIAQGGLAAVLSQTFRTMIHSRLALGMKDYARRWPGADIVLVEPDAQDRELFGANPFSFGQRRRMAEHAYQQTRAWLRSHEASLAPRLARHGIALRTHALHDEGRVLVQPWQPRRLGSALQHLSQVLDELERKLQPA